MPYVSRGGDKLAYALDVFGLDPRGRVCADLGCSTGGFTDVLLQRDAARVYAVDTGYGVLDWKLRNDARVVVLERTNALHVELPEPCGLVVIDAGWTRQARILPRALDLLGPGGEIVTLLKPHYEAPRDWLEQGRLPEARHPEVLASVLDALSALDVEAGEPLLSPVRGGKGGNREYLLRIVPRG
ncbi:TlyA family rRNA (cytidine-2'-O)-methyltransferase [bacterium]|nr:TlyA family rRNA (cytidine-2'-O)-methyltransferase [bacterium]